jgi:hypothetical protein
MATRRPTAPRVSAKLGRGRLGMAPVSLSRWVDLREASAEISGDLSEHPDRSGRTDRSSCRCRSPWGRGNLHLCRTPATLESIGRYL